MSRYYDRKGNAISLVEWASRMERDTQHRVVGHDQVDEETEVSTVWLGLDHRFLGEGPPLIFETMIFGGPYGGWQWRYSTEEEAATGHERVVLSLAANKAPDFE